MKIKIFIIFILFPNFIFGQIPNTLTPSDKIYGLSKFWQEVNYNFVYLDKIDKEKWDNLYREFIVEVQKTENDYEYYRLLQKFCSYLNDGHTNVFFPKSIYEILSATDFGNYQIQISNLEGKAIVTGINKNKQSEIPIGSEIVKINGINTREYLNEKVIPYISSSTDHIREDWGIKYLFEGYYGTTYDVEIILPNKEIKSFRLTIEKSTIEKNSFSNLNNSPFDFKWLDDDIAYIALNTFSTWDTSSLFFEKLSELQKAKKLVIDLRENGGGDTPIAKVIFQSLTSDTLLYGSRSFSRKHIPTFKAWGRWSNEQHLDESSRINYLSSRDQLFYEFPYNPDTVSSDDLKFYNNQRIVVPTVILIGHNTASAAEDFLIYADNQSHMTKIGEPTFGSTGQPYIFDLPGGGVGRVCTKKDTYPDGREFVGIGIQPDIVVSKTLHDYIHGQDPVLEQAILFLNSN